MSSQPVEENPRIERVIEESLQRVDSPEAARKVVERVERLAGSRTEEQLGQAAGVIQKPFDYDDLVSQVEQATNASETKPLALLR